jgi:hypothetical protein
MKRKTIAVAVIVAMIIITLTGCFGGGAELKRPEMSEGATAYEITGNCEAALNGEVLTVSGACDIADGTYGTISVYSINGEELDSTVIVKTGDNLTYDFTVEDKWSGEVYGFITFDTVQAGTQPDAILAMYGKKFENITGENVVWDSHGNAVVFQSEIITLP